MTRELIAELRQAPPASLAPARSILAEKAGGPGGTSRLASFYPDTGPLRRELYVKHLRFFRLGRTVRERMMLAANRIGKTEGIGGYETTLHLIGLYPHWWEGRRFDKPIRAWVAGRTSITTRDIVQAKLLGRPTLRGGRKTFDGSGLIPGHLIERVSWRHGIADFADTVSVRHAGGGTSLLQFKSYEQGRTAFEGTEQDVIWLDEEPSLAVYTECVVRTMTTDGIVYVTFTPLQGMSEVVMLFLDARPELQVVEE
ncbi:MAG: terminase family protein [Enhydrobacter sp.]|nr:MAG: terminase family protein [Enhydrobacter sp.]